MHRLLIAALFLLAAASINAQEATAGQNYDAQSTWSALSNRIDLATNQNTLLNSTLNKFLLCESRLRFFAPASTDPSKDADGCVLPPIPDDLQVTTKVFSKFGIHCNGAGFVCKDSTGCGCHADNDTALQTCKQMGYTKLTGITTDSFNSPGNNSMVKWDVASQSFIRGSVGSMGNRKILSLSCYTITRTPAATPAP